ncbi:hypothetical protein EST38_g12376 [Candolleomyces aberdarensis]|uniref:Uncharacterized protein n=1 Tax=Candolleomyces aberdarensis TaxID=2316362 RepID=A0A4Q2D2J4_9AGAR|nr:hypothetical protein EST38_g12376 [Candolleomyces aberdarensis]
MSRANNGAVLGSFGRIGDPQFPWPHDLYSLEITDRSKFEELERMGRRFVMKPSERAFVVAMSCFVNQAKRERREEAFLGQFYGRVFAKWPEPYMGEKFHIYQAERRTYLRLRLLKCHDTAHRIEPPCDWEVFLALPDLEHRIMLDYLIEKGREDMRELGNRIMARDATASAPVVDNGNEFSDLTGLDDESMEGTDDDITEDGSGSEDGRSDIVSISRPRSPSVIVISDDEN